MSNIKKIPCRVCGKLFEPCAYCQKNSDVFRWRNFACSIDCASKYVAEATAYRESKHKEETPVVQTEIETENIVSEKQPTEVENEVEAVDEQTEEVVAETVEEFQPYKKKKNRN